MLNVVFVMVDGQEDFARMALGDEAGESAIKVAGEVAKFAAEHDARDIIYTMDTHGENYLDTQEGKNLPVIHCVPGTKGFELCHEIMADAGVRPDQCRIVQKVTFGSETLMLCKDVFTDADLVVMCGLRTDICVVSNYSIIKAIAPETPIVVVEDACAGVTSELHEAALMVMKSCQARVMKWADLKQELEAKYIEA